MIHERRFLELTLLLSAVSCGARSSPESPPTTALTPSSAPVGEPDAAPAHVSTLEPAVVATPASADAPQVETPSCNDQGDVSACSLISPTCESGNEYAQACQDFTRLLRPKVVERVARCIVKQQGRGRCAPNTSLRSCFKSALQNGCTDPGAEAVCQDLQAQCRAAGKNPTYSVAACAKVVSAVRARPGTPDWHDADLDMFGPADERGSCSLAGVLPYQPFDR